MTKYDITHAELVKASRRWLTNGSVCRFVLTEFRSAFFTEQPDAIGYKGLIGVLIECKTNRADFSLIGKNGDIAME